MITLLPRRNQFQNFSTIKPLISDRLNFLEPLNRGLIGYWLAQNNRSFDLSYSHINTFSQKNVIFSARNGLFIWDMTSGAGETVIIADDNPRWALTDQFSMIARVRMLNTSTHVFIAQDTGAGNNRKWLWHYNTIGAVNSQSFHVNNTVSNEFINGTTFTIDTTKFYTLGITRNAGLQYRFYRDGVADGAATGTLLPGDAAIPLYLGFAEASYTLNGYIEYAKIYNRVLMPEEMYELHRNPYVGWEKPRTYWNGITLGPTINKFAVYRPYKSYENFPAKPDKSALFAYDNPIAKGMQLYFPFNEQAAVPQSIINRHALVNLSLVGGAVLGPKGLTLPNNTSSDKLQTTAAIPTNIVPNILTGTMVFDTTVNFTDTDSVEHWLIHYGVSGSNIFNIGKWSDNIWYAGWNAGTDHRIAISASGTLPGLGQRAFIVFRWNTSGAVTEELLINRRSIGTRSSVLTTAVLPSNFILGNAETAGPVSTYSWNDAIQWFGQWNRWLSNEELLELQNNPYQLLQPIKKNVFLIEATIPTVPIIIITSDSSTVTESVTVSEYLSINVSDSSALTEIGVGSMSGPRQISVSSTIPLNTDAILTDTFERSLLSDGGWVDWNDPFGTDIAGMTIVGGKVRPSQLGGDDNISELELDMFNIFPDMWVQAEITSLGVNGFPGVGVRTNEVGNGYFVEVSTTGTSLYKWIFGTYTLIYGDPNYVWQVGDVVRLEAEKTKLTVKQNGIILFERYDEDIAYGRVAIEAWVDPGGSLSEAELDNFSYGVFPEYANVVFNPIPGVGVDSSTVTESVTIQLNALQISVNESITLSEAISLAGLPLGISVAEALTLTESITLRINPLYITIVEVITLTEDSPVLVNPLRANVSDSSALSENITIEFGLASAFHDLEIRSTTIANQDQVHVITIGAVSALAAQIHTISITQNIEHLSQYHIIRIIPIAYDADSHRSETLKSITGKRIVTMFGRVEKG